jgi:hypothetical protein
MDEPGHHCAVTRRPFDTSASTDLPNINGKPGNRVWTKAGPKQVRTPSPAPVSDRVCPTHCDEPRLPCVSVVAAGPPSCLRDTRWVVSAWAESPITGASTAYRARYRSRSVTTAKDGRFGQSSRAMAVTVLPEWLNCSPL